MVDGFNREAPAIEVAAGLPVHRKMQALERVAAWRGYPLCLRADNGPEMITVAIVDWAEDHKVAQNFTWRGEPNRNYRVERFHWASREEDLVLYVFPALREVWNITGGCLSRYNQEGFHESPGNLTPVEPPAANNPDNSAFDGFRRGGWSGTG